jgi:flagellar biosynthesis GTPase FlhF
MTLPNPDRAKVLWSKGQNFFSAFFAELQNVRKEIGNDAMFSKWCWDELHLGLMAITRVADVLSVVDAAKAKAELATTRAAEQEQKRKEREQREAFAAADRKRKEEEKAAAAAEKARNEELEKQRQKAADKHARKVASKQKNNAGFKAKQRQDKKAALVKLAESSGQNIVPFVAKPVEISEDDLVRQIKTAIANLEAANGEIAAARSKWIDMSVVLAGLLVDARSRYPANLKFSEWLNQNDIKISVQDRAALLSLGLDMQAMRVILEQTERTSYRQIWEEVRLQIASK